MRSLAPSRRLAYAMFGWLAIFVVSHAIVAAYPGDDPGGDGPWGRTAFVVYNLILIAIAAVGAVVVLATIRPWGRRVPHWLLLAPLWIGSGLLVVRGVPGMIENAVMATGISPGGLMGSDDVSTTELWTGLAINTYFFVGAVLLVPTTLGYLHRSRSEPDRRPAVDTAGVVGPAR